MIILDTAVLQYSIGGEHPLRVPCRRIVRAVEAGTADARTTTFVIQEFLHVASGRSGRAYAADRARDFARMLAPLLPHDASQVPDALELYERHDALGAFDAFLAAAARAADAPLVSPDHAFADVSGLHHVDPATPELDSVLG